MKANSTYCYKTPHKPSWLSNMFNSNCDNILNDYDKTHICALYYDLKLATALCTINT